MIRYIVILLCLLGMLTGCNKNKTAVNNADEASNQSENSVKTEIATGELKEVLLALRRVHFARDSEELLPDSIKALDEAAPILASKEDVSLYVDGHTDERGTTEHNMALGQRRAKTVADYLNRLGVPEGMLAVTSHGEETPLSAGNDNTAYAKNRRVEFRLMKGDVRLILEPGTLIDDKGQRIE
jgi:peptidoglycan-associated lipoprotein